MRISQFGALLLIMAGIGQMKVLADSIPSSDRIVVMVNVDGLAAFYFDDPKAEMPTIRKLAEEGARSTMIRASTPTVTWPNHTTPGRSTGPFPT